MIMDKPLIVFTLCLAMLCTQSYCMKTNLAKKTLNHADSNLSSDSDEYTDSMESKENPLGYPDNDPALFLDNSSPASELAHYFNEYKNDMERLEKSILPNSSAVIKRIRLNKIFIASNGHRYRPYCEDRYYNKSLIREFMAWEPVDTASPLPPPCDRPVPVIASATRPVFWYTTMGITIVAIGCLIKRYLDTEATKEEIGTPEQPKEPNSSVDRI